MLESDFRLIPLIDTHKAFSRSEAAEYEDDRPFLSEYLAHFQSRFDARADYNAVRKFLKSNGRNETTFNNYRTQVERLLLWSWNKRGKSFLTFLRSDMEDFMEFCTQPDPSWISTSISSRYVLKDGVSEPNPEWRPFNKRTQKAAAKQAAETNRELPEPAFRMANSSIGQVYAILNSLFTYCAADRIMESNPCALIKRDRALKKWNSKELQVKTQKSLSKLQWDFVIDTAEAMALAKPDTGERTLLCIVLMFGCYLRVSDLVGNGVWKPTMGCFVRDREAWWYHVIGKGNLQEKIGVRPDCMDYLVRYRRTRGLSDYPSPGEVEPLLRTVHGRAGITSRQIRIDVQAVFDRASDVMRSEGIKEYEISSLRSATLHWFRHTGATFDAPHRSPKHLQADLRHASLATTQNVYYNVDDDERASELSQLSIRR
ncbi:tyrosine-type recombinase/integrase [Pseudomonas tritici]|uniref:tyrosine-type recombinase/integrase n=1 Tax=Pseudomonas tritici TaxID=2745518 RepID=UPI00387AB386